MVSRIVLIAGLALASCTPALAQSQAAPSGPASPGCGNYREIGARLTSQYGEKPLLSMAMAGGNAVVIWVNLDKHTWTSLVVQGDKACEIGEGTGLDFSPEAPPLPGQGV